MAPSQWAVAASDGEMLPHFVCNIKVIQSPARPVPNSPCEQGLWMPPSLLRRVRTAERRIFAGKRSANPREQGLAGIPVSLSRGVRVSRVSRPPGRRQEGEAAGGCYETGDVLGTAEWGERFACAVARPPLYGVQFHPEKSSAAGLRVLANFAEICASVPA